MFHSFHYLDRMKSILIPGFTIVILLYTIMFFVDHRFWPEEAGQKIFNIVLILFTLYLSYDAARIYLLKKEKEENAFVYKVASTGKKIYLNTVEHIRPFHKEFLTWLAIAGGIIVVSFVLLGMPGALLLEIPPLLKLAKPISGDSAWPAALLLSMLWPLLLPAGVLVKHALIRNGHSSFALAGWIGVVIGGVILLITIIYWGSDKK